MKKKKNILIFITVFTLIFLIIFGITYAYFSTRIDGNDKQSINVTTQDLEITFSGGTNAIIPENTEYMEPGVTFTKTFSVKNTGNGPVKNYAVYLEDVVNEIVLYNDYSYSLECKEYNSDTNEYVKDCEGNSGYYPHTDDLLTMNNIDEDRTHNYTLTINYKETGTDQSVDMENRIEGKIEIYDHEEVSKLYVSDQEYLVNKLYGVNLKYGDKVSYTSGVEGDTSNWKFMGIEDGHILLLADTNVTTLTLSSREGYLNGLTLLQNAVEPYGKGDNAVNVRSVKVEDVNKVTGYNPAKELNGRPHEYGKAYEYGKVGTWTIEPTDDGVGKIVYSNNAEVTGEDLDPKFILLNNEQLKQGETYTEQNSFYTYSARTSGVPYHDQNNNYDHLVISQNELELFIEKNIKPDDQGLGSVERANRYWLANQATLGKVGTLSHGIMHLGSNTGMIRVFRERLANSYDQLDTYTYGVRPVVYLDKKITLSYDSANSIWNVSKIK